MKESNAAPAITLSHHLITKIIPVAQERMLFLDTCERLCNLEQDSCYDDERIDSDQELPMDNAWVDYMRFDTATFDKDDINPTMKFLEDYESLRVNGFD